VLFINEIIKQVSEEKDHSRLQNAHL